ncbi:MAG TPA: universal stress protein [Pirellulales bacterium]|jgi:nucleotide-binding universal stress UspA family protein|nr:universal stress protein [Pirellulales bacterium]
MHRPSLTHPEKPSNIQALSQPQQLTAPLTEVVNGRVDESNRRENDAMFKKILIACDSSPSAYRAFRLGLEIAEKFDASITVLAVAQLPEPASIVESTTILELATEHYQTIFADLRKLAAAVGIVLETRVAIGHAAEQILHCADEEKVDLIVMGHRGKSAIKRWLLGSVSKRVISYATCSVLIAR